MDLLARAWSALPAAELQEVLRLVSEQSVARGSDALVRAIGDAPFFFVQEPGDHLSDGHCSHRLASVGFALQFNELLKR